MHHRYSEIEENVRIMWAATPDHLRYDRMPVNDYHHGWLTIVYIYLNYLYTCFLLQRALIKHTNTSREALCDVSRRALSIVVITITSQRHSMVDLDKHYSWIVCSSPFKCVIRISLLTLTDPIGPHIRTAKRQCPPHRAPPPVPRTRPPYRCHPPGRSDPEHQRIHPIAILGLTPRARKLPCMQRSGEKTIPDPGPIAGPSACSGGYGP